MGSSSWAKNKSWGGFQGSNEFPAIHGILMILITRAWESSSFPEATNLPLAKEQWQWAHAYLEATGMTVLVPCYQHLCSTGSSFCSTPAAALQPSSSSFSS